MPISNVTERELTATGTGAAHAVAALEANGVDTVFGIPGVHTLALYDALRASTIRHVLARHEQGVGFMADGYARATGRPGVACVITGPGVTNIATPIGQAYTDSSPVFVLSSNVERSYLDSMRGSLHDLKDQPAVMAAVTKWNGRVMTPADVAPMINEAFKQMTTGRQQPVHVEIPLDVLDLLSESEAIDHASPGPIAEPSNDEIEHAAEMLAGACRPIIYCGGGAVSSGAAPYVLQIAELLNAPVVTSIMGKGAIPEDHGLSLGGNWSSGNQIDAMMRASDAVLVVGSKLGAQATDDFTLRFPSPLIRIDIDPVEMHLNAQPDVALLGEAHWTLSRLIEAISAAGRLKSEDRRAAVAAARTDAENNAWLAVYRSYVDALRRSLPRDGILTNDMTMMSYAANALYPVYEPRTYFFPSGYGTLGFAVPAAIGAKIGRPERAVVAIVGDGGFQYTMAEVGCAVQEQLGLPIVIFNDSTYTAVKDAQAQWRGGRFIGVDLVNPDFVKLAEAYEISGVRAESPDQMAREIGLALERDLPTIVEVPIAPWV